MKLTNEIKLYLKSNHVDFLVKQYDSAMYNYLTHGIKNNNYTYITSTYNTFLYDIDKSCIIDNTAYDNLQLIQASRQMTNNEYKKRSRCNKKINEMLSNGSCLFITLTFSNEYYLSTSIDTRRRYIRDYLNSLNTLYVCNHDFGKKNGRHHFHAIVQTDYIDTHTYKYGSLDVEKINTSNTKKVSDYVSKLTEHTLKSTTRNYKLIISKGFSA